MILFILAVVAGLLDRIAVALLAAAVVLCVDLIAAANLLGGGTPMVLAPSTIAMALAQTAITMAAGFLIGLVLRGLAGFIRRQF